MRLDVWRVLMTMFSGTFYYTICRLRLFVEFYSILLLWLLRADVSGYPSERRLTCPNLRPPKSPPNLLKVGTAMRVGCNLRLRRAMVMTMLPHVKGVYHLCML
jgi:hypothetical protein